MLINFMFWDGTEPDLDDYFYSYYFCFLLFGLINDCVLLSLHVLLLMLFGFISGSLVVSIMND